MECLLLNVAIVIVRERERPSVCVWEPIVCTQILNIVIQSNRFVSILWQFVCSAWRHWMFLVQW